MPELEAELLVQGMGGFVISPASSSGKLFMSLLTKRLGADQARPVLAAGKSRQVPFLVFKLKKEFTQQETQPNRQAVS